MGAVTPPRAVHWVKIMSITGSGACWAHVERSICTMVAEACMDERKADHARSSTLLIPTPPSLTGSDASAQVPREIRMFLMSLSRFAVFREVLQEAEHS